MGQVLIRNLDERVIETFKARAKIRGHSLEQELRDVINQAAPLSPAERVARADKIAAMQAAPAATPSEAVIRQIRDRET